MLKRFRMEKPLGAKGSAPRGILFEFGLLAERQEALALRAERHFALRSLGNPSLERGAEVRFPLSMKSNALSSSTN
jgi:hypothetical protein